MLTLFSFNTEGVLNIPNIRLTFNIYVSLICNYT